MIQFSYFPGPAWLLGGALLGGAAIFLSYFRAKGGSRRWLRMLLAGVRVLTIGAVVLCLFGPEWVEAIKHQQKSRIAVLLDTSRSMSIKDLPGGRLDAAKTWLQKTFAPSVPASTAVDYYSFDQALARLPSVDSAAATGTGTGLADALEGLLSIPRDDPLAAVIVCSDGIENISKDPEAVAKLYRRKGVPIHTATLGTTNDMQDIIIENVQVKRAVPNQAPTKIGLNLRASGYRNQTVPVQVLRSNEIIAVTSLKLKDGPQRVELDFIPRQKGFQVYEVRIPPQRGEWLTTNNRRMFGVEVMDPTLRVIYMEGTPQQPGSPIPEWKYLKTALESDPNIKVKVLYRQFGSGGQFLNTVDADPETGEKVYPVEHPTHGFPRTLEALLDYDVIIHSDIRKESFSAEQLQNMARLVEEYGGGFVMIGGNSAFGKGGYHRTILDRIIPVAMERENDSQARPLHLRVPPAALNHPLMALGATREETELIWSRKFPLLYGYNLVDRAKPGATVLAEDPSAENAYGPRLLLAVQNIGKGRSMAFTSDTTQSWGKDFERLWGEPVSSGGPAGRQNCDSRYYRQFWVNAVRWLAAGRIGRTNNPVTLELAQSYCAPNEPVAATVKVRDADLKEIGGAEVTLFLVSGGKTNLAVTSRFDPVTRSYRADLLPRVSGDFTVTAVAMSKGQKKGEDRQLLVAEEGDREMADLRAQPQLMANLARASGGKVLPVLAEQAPLPIDFGTPPPITVEYRRTPLWDKSWWLAAILFLLALEWGIRRLSGLA